MYRTKFGIKIFVITRKTYKTKYLDTISYGKLAFIENKNSMQVEIFSRIDASLVYTLEIKPNLYLVSV